MIWLMNNHANEYYSNHICFGMLLYFLQVDIHLQSQNGYGFNMDSTSVLLQHASSHVSVQVE